MEITDSSLIVEKVIEVLKLCALALRSSNLCLCRDMINSIRACKTAAEERTVVTKECTALRDLLKEPVQYHRHRNIAKLIFIHMMGYPTHFGQMECIKLIAEGDFPEKRIGYLGLMVLLDERQEVLMLVTNSIKKYPIPIHAESMLGFPVSIVSIEVFNNKVFIVFLWVLWNHYNCLHNLEGI